MTAGFFDIDAPDQPALVVVRQVGDHRFRLLKGFTYRGPSGDVHHVYRWHLPCTDLTSVPQAFSWLEGRFGRHTLAALLHDHQVAPWADDPSGQAYQTRRVRADDRFLEALGVLGVAWVRRHLMWSAVHALTRIRHHGAWARVAMLIWAAASLAGTAVAVWGIATLSWEAMAVAAIGPLPAAWLWMVGDRRPLRRWWCGVVAGYGVVAFLPTTALTAVVVLIRDTGDLITGGKGPSPWPADPTCPERQPHR